MVQLETGIHFLSHHGSKLLWFKDFRPPRPRQQPIADFFQAVDPKRQDEAVIWLRFGFLSVVPLGFRRVCSGVSHLGSVVGEYHAALLPTDGSLDPSLDYLGHPAVPSVSPIQRRPMQNL